MFVRRLNLSYFIRSAATDSRLKFTLSLFLVNWKYWNILQTMRPIQGAYVRGLQTLQCCYEGRSHENRYTYRLPHSAISCTSVNPFQLPHIVNYGAPFSCVNLQSGKCYGFHFNRNISLFSRRLIVLYILQRQKLINARPVETETTQVCCKLHWPMCANQILPHISKKPLTPKVPHGDAPDI